MAREVVIAIEIAEIHLAKSILDEMEGLPDVQALQWVDGIGEKGQSAVKGSPDIIILDEHPQAGDLFKRIHALRRNFPQTALFVISSDKSPHHIVEVMKAGVAEYLITPLDRNTLQAAIDEVRTKLANEGKIAKGSVYSFISSKGGLGSTVIAVNTAAAMAAKKNEAVAFLDMSFRPATPRSSWISHPTPPSPTSPGTSTASTLPFCVVSWPPHLPGWIFSPLR